MQGTPLEDALRELTVAFGENPTDVIGRLEWELPGIATGDVAHVGRYLSAAHFTASTYYAALELKRVAGQVNVLVHAAGILASLPYILEPGEKNLSLSLGAGNTGKEFDLETDRRIAEFKFIAWRGGPESIRQNQLFKDFLKLLWDQSGRRKQLYLTGTTEALKFLRAGRALSSVLSRGDAVKQAFAAAYGDRFTRVGEFYREFGKAVEIIDLRSLVPALASAAVPAEEPPLEEL